MFVGLYSTAELIGIQRMPETPRDFWTQFFPRVVTSDKQEVMFDDLGLEDRRLAPFVLPTQQGRVMTDRGFQTRSFKPPYLKPKHIVDATKAVARMAGERLTGELSLAQRFELHTAMRLLEQRRMIERRWDVMACQAIMDAQLIISDNEDYPEPVALNFGRHASLTYALTGGARWSPGNSPSPLTDIAVARRNAYERSGYAVTTLIFGLDAWTWFTSNSEVAALLSNQRRGGNSDFRQATLSAGEPFAYEGFISGPDGIGGRLDLWTYGGTYENSTGTQVRYVPNNVVVGVGQVDGVRAFGAIMDRRSLVPAEMFPKMWEEEDPSVTYCMTQSAPLMVPMRPNGSFKITVS